MATYRGWITIVRQRQNGQFHAAEQHLADLAKQRPEVFRTPITVYGDVDIVLPIETESLCDIHHAIININACGGILYTKTLIASQPDFSNAQRFVGPQAFIGICTLAGRQQDTRDRLMQIEGFDVADVVFGEYDIMAAFKAGYSYNQRLYDALRRIDTIRKTTTMLPFPVIAGV
jgi:hypothetical protein